MKNFKEESINWNELNVIGISKEQLEESGNLEKLLQGEKTEILPLNLTISGIHISMDANLQLVQSESDQTTIVQVIGVTPI